MFSWVQRRESAYEVTFVFLRINEVDALPRTASSFLRQTALGFDLISRSHSPFGLARFLL
jgi:hypothetical protein